VPPVNLKDPASGETFEVPEEQVASRLREGWTVEGTEAKIDRLTAERREADYGGAVDTAIAGGLAVARGATHGGSDVLADLVGEGDTVAALREANPYASIGGEIAGSFLGGGAGAAKLGAQIAAKGTTTAGKIGSAAAGFATEGAIIGAGQGVSELALSADPVSLERAASVIGSNVLFGGGTGAIIGAGGAAVGAALRKGKQALDEIASRPQVADDLAGLDAKQLRAARDGEVESLVAAQTQQKAATVDELAAYRQTVKDANPWLVVTEGEASSLLTQSGKALRNAMNDPIGLAKTPGTALKALRVQEQALTRAMAESEEIAARLAKQSQKLAKDLGEELATLPDNLDSVVLSGKTARKYGAFADVKVPKAGEVKISREKAAEFLDALNTGAVQGSEQAALKKLPDLLTANRTLQQKIEAASLSKADLVSDRLKAIDDAKDALTSGGKRGIGEQMASGAGYSAGATLASLVPGIGGFLAPFVGAKFASVVNDGLGKSMAEAAKRASSGIQRFLDVGAKVAPAAPVLATKTLAAVRYAEKEGGTGSTLPELYKARTSEIRSQISIGPDGQPQMRQDARAKMAAKLAPLRAADPLLADRMETAAARRVTFLAANMPRRPDLGAIPTGPDRWQPSDLAMRSWARLAAAAEDPSSIADRLAAGTVTPEDAQVMRELYPEMLAEMTQQILEQLPTLRASLPYHRRLAMSILTGVPVDAAMNPRILRILQGSFQQEPGTAGGTQAPMAQAQFGSVRAAPGTLSQRREQQS
jgi:hypothetical protein